MLRLLPAVIFLHVSDVAAQTFYKWTDAGGIVHFSDNPPAQANNVEERHLAPQPETRADSDEPAIVVKPAGEAAPATPAIAPTGPARVVITKRSSPRTGPSELHVTGEVRNVGGAPADGVRVAINALDSGQGNPCLHQEVPVSPATLHPGETGKFDIDLDSPCLFGQPTVDVVPSWD